MKVQIILIRQIWDRCRIPARFMDIGRIRKKGLLDLALQQLFGRRKNPFHLIKYNAVIRERPVHIRQFIVPALLLENLLLLIDIRIKYGVEIHIHQIAEIFIVAARNRVHRLIRIRHRVQERVDERIFHRKMF